MASFGRRSVPRHHGHVLMVGEGRLGVVESGGGEVVCLYRPHPSTAVSGRVEHGVKTCRYRAVLCTRPLTVRLCVPCDGTRHRRTRVGVAALRGW
jgi:hypothetical protein